MHAIDERTLEIDLENPAPYLPGLLKHQTAYPAPKHVIENGAMTGSSRPTSSSTGRIRW
ncbi:MAG: hypothetical protein WDN76_11195 [Alphaproteobacteria bacterium]